MPEKFEVTLVGNDQLGGMLERNIEKVSELAASTKEANASMGKEGNKDALSGLDLLDKKFSAMADSAKKNVQHLGDMVPPLKNIGALVGPLGKLGIAGAAVYGVTRIATSMGDMAQHAYSMDNSAKNIGLSAEKLSMVYGAFRLAGVDEQAASQSLVTVADTFNDILRGGENGNRVLSQLEAMGMSRDMIPVQYDAYGNQTVIVDKLLPVLDGIYDSIQSPQIRHEFTRATGMDDGMEALLRGDRSVQDRYQQAYDIGLVRLEETNQRLNEFNSTLTQTSASISGWWNRTKNDTADWLLSDGSVMNGIAGVGEVFNHGDRGAWQMASGLNLDDDSAMWRTMQGDSQYEQFKSTLGWWNRFQLGSGVMPEGVWDEFVGFKQQSNPDYKDPFAGRVGRNTLVRGTPIGEDDPTAASMHDVSSTAASIDAMSYINAAPQDVKQQWLSHLERTYGLPPSLLDRVWQTESNRGRNLLSPAGAEGPFQFMPQTGSLFGLNTTGDRMDFVKSSEAAARMLSQNMQAFGGDVQRTVASYNYGGSWNRWGQPLPIETQNYLSAIMPGLPSYHDPRKYGGINAHNGSNAQELANQFAQAMNQNPTQVNINITNGRETQTVSVRTGGTVTTSMAF